MKRIIENVTKYQDKDTQEKDKEVVEVNEKTETDEEPVVTMMKNIVRSISNRVKEKKKQKDVTQKSSMKDTEIVKEKTPQEKSVRKKRKVEEKTVEKKSLKRKLVQTSDSETNDEDFLDIMHIVRRKVDGKRILMNVPILPQIMFNFILKQVLRSVSMFYK